MEEGEFPKGFQGVEEEEEGFIEGGKPLSSPETLYSPHPSLRGQRNFHKGKVFCQLLLALLCGSMGVQMEAQCGLWSTMKHE